MPQGKVELKGAAKYKQDLKGITLEAKLLASQMKLVESSFTSSTSAQEKQERSMATLNAQIELQKKKIESINKAIDEETAKEKVDEKAITQLTIERNNAVAALNDLQKGTEKVADSVEEVAQKEDDASEKTNIFGANLKANLISDAVVAGVKAIGNAIMDVAKSCVDAYTETVQWADDLATLSTVTGISTDALQEYEYMADLMDVDIDTITGSLTKLTRNMESSREGTGAAAEAFAKLGIATTDVNGELRNNQDVFADVIDALGQVENETERDAMAMEIFGKSAQELNPMIEAGSESMAGWAEEAEQMGYIMDGEALDGLLDSADAAARLTNKMTALKRTAVSQFAPGIAAAIDDVVGVLDGSVSVEDFLNKVVEIASGIIDKIGEVMPTVVNALAKAVPQMIPVIVKLIAKMAVAMVKSLPVLYKAIVEMIKGCIVTIREKWPEIKQAGIEFLLKIKDGITEKVGEVKEKVSEMVQGAIQKVKDKFESMKSAGADLIANVKSGITSKVEEVKTNVSTMVSDCVQKVKDKFTDVKQAGKDFVDNLWSGISDKVAWIKQQITNLVGNVREWLKSIFGIGGGGGTDTGRGGATMNSGIGYRASVPYGAMSASVGNNTANYGAITVNVYGAEGQSVNALANAVMNRIESAYNMRGAAWA